MEVKKRDLRVGQGKRNVRIKRSRNQEHPLDNCIFLDPKRTLNLDFIETTEPLKQVLGRFGETSFQTACCVLANTYECMGMTYATGRPVYLAVSRWANTYVGTRIYYPYFTYSKVNKTVDYFEKAGLIQVYPGYYDKDAKEGKRTKIHPTEILMEIFRGNSIKLASSKPVSPVIYKYDKKRYGPAPNKEADRRMCNRLNRINGGNENHYFSLRLTVYEDYVRSKAFENKESPGPGNLEWGPAALSGYEALVSSNTITHNDLEEIRRKCWILRELGKPERVSGYSIDFTEMMPYTRIFNDGKNYLGGRFYCWAQCIPSVLRYSIEIDGEPTTERDFSGMLPRLLYALKGVEYVGDPYDFQEYDRDAAKDAVIVAVNARNEINAAEGLRNKGYKEPEKMLRAAKKEHPGISKYFYSGIGKAMQYKDSLIAEKVMLRFAREGESVIGYHDGFVVKRTLREELDRVMTDAYRAETGFEPVIK